MTPGQIETALTFLISKLPEDQLAELDAQMEGASMEPSSSLAQDSARKAWLELGSAGRQAVRTTRRSRITQDAASNAEFAKQFPHLNRLA